MKEQNRDQQQKENPYQQGYSVQNKAMGLYRSSFEKDNCGIGVIVDIKGRQSHKTVERTLTIVENLSHRAGKDAEGETGDGVGIMLQICHSFFSAEAVKLGFSTGEERCYGIGMFFFPQEELKRNQAKKMFEIVAAQEGLRFLGWREVPVNPDVLGKRARDKMPSIWQGFVGKPDGVEKGLDFDRILYVAKRVFEQSNDATYVCSLSSRTIVYKGMFLVDQLRTFYKDLQNKAYCSAIGIVHSRFSTNTLPSWEKAHPYRMLVHNGEINTINGNVDKMLLREDVLESGYFDANLHKIYPAIDVNGSDSARLDNMIEFLVMNGVDLPLAVMVTVPEPWINDKTMDLEKRNFYKYYATMLEPWDGPASLIFSDGDVVGALLDRNGLRPSRYYITDDDQLILSSEVGVLELDEAKIIRKDRLRPGKMLLVDTVRGVLVDDENLKKQYARRSPYGEWIENNVIKLKKVKIPNSRIEHYEPKMRARLQKAFGYSYEDFNSSILAMAETGAEPMAAMGSDNPLPVLSKRRQPLFTYFKQQFAQVTNPPLDAIREELVTATEIYLGNTGNLLQEKPENCRVLRIDQPILSGTDMLKIRGMKHPGFKIETVSILHYKGTRLKMALNNLFAEVDYRYKQGANIIILSDRGVDENHVAIPSLLAVSAVWQHLIRTQKGNNISLILESGEPREVHHFATLMGFGASAIYPYLAHETIYELIQNRILDKDFHTAVDDYNHAVLHGIVKIASKMGISTLQSYQGSKVFEAVGIDEDIVKEYFTGTLSRIGGISLEDMDAQMDELHSMGFDPLGLETDLSLESTGGHKLRSGAEDHLYNPVTIHLLQQAVWKNDYDLYKRYAKTVVGEGREMNLRGIMKIKYPEKGIPISAVESEESIIKRFHTGAMSYGAMSPEVHEDLAVAMNHIGGRANTGEGGQPAERNSCNEQGVYRGCTIKQIASGRFGVTSEYLVHADELQIKMAQGAKPGEGGHLPGNKIYPWVADTRNSTPGVGLISPPPHHDIYSIEDLAQLIYDLKNANKYADISVKLASEAGVGTVAAGVAKAGAQAILICGATGGTGAAARSSIYNAGLPWEMGIAEAQQTLMINGLRGMIRLEVDGKLMTGRDVLVAALLGAEGYGFSTAPLIALGCVMMRVCNLDTCPMGITTQNPELRKNYKGKPEYVENFMRFIARDLREHMARLGVATIDELIGHSEYLELRENLGDKNPRSATLDLSGVLTKCEGGPVHFEPAMKYNFELEKTPDEKILLKEFDGALQTGEGGEVDITIHNTDRTFGTLLGAEITRRFDDKLEDHTFRVRCKGHGGQSFGAFIPKGLTIAIEGDSNDYIGKGLSGGILAVYPPKKSLFEAESNIAIGNVALYGATSGKLFVNGVAGERFAVRNSGATAVVEGVGNHGCEYMTGGTVVVLGETGKNFAAGMSGGVAYVLDEDNRLYLNLNKEMVYLEPITDTEDIQELKALLKEHVRMTGSAKASRVLEDYASYVAKFRKVIPREYKEMLLRVHSLMDHGLSEEQARSEAFYAKKKELEG